MLKAAVDVGTNTSRLLIAAEHDGKITPVLVKRRITRLGGGFSEQTGLAEDAAERTVEALAEFAGDISASGAQRVRAVATSAVRDAANGVAFRDRVQKETGIPLEIIEGSEEGFLTLRGALAGIDDPTGMFMVFDVGGGSTEYTVSEGSSLLFSRSLPLGVVRLTEGKKSVENMKEKIRRETALLQEEMAKLGTAVDPAEVTLVATAGTATTVAAIDLKLETYDYRLVNNHVLTLDRIREIFNMLLPLSSEERLAVPGLEKGREDLIIAGMLIMIHTMESWGFKTLKVNDFGLLEGVLLSA